MNAKHDRKALEQFLSVELFFKTQKKAEENDLLLAISSIHYFEADVFNKYAIICFPNRKPATVHISDVCDNYVEIEERVLNAWHYISTSKYKD